MMTLCGGFHPRNYYIKFCAFCKLTILSQFVI